MTIYQDYEALSKFFGHEAFDKLESELLADLSISALTRLQGIIMQAIAKKLEEKQ